MSLFWKRIFLVSFCLCLVLALVLTGCTKSQTPPRQAVTSTETVLVSIDAPGKVPAGGDFKASINISYVKDFDAANFDVTFDPAVLRLDSITSGTITDYDVPVDIYNEVAPGKFIIVQNMPGVTGVTGSGSLVVLHFHVVGSSGQRSDINLSNGFLSSNLAEEIVASWTGDTVSIYSPDEKDRR